MTENGRYDREPDAINYYAPDDPGGFGPIEQSERKAGFSVPGSKIHRPDKPLYMVRWVLLRIFSAEIRINCFMSSDPDCLHDHPAAFVSIILAGGYREITPTRTRAYHAPCVLFRRAKWQHRIEIDGPCLSLNFVWPRCRNWGFWTRQGWIPWKKYNEGTHRC